MGEGLLAVDDILVVEVLDGEDDLRGVELSPKIDDHLLLLRKALLLGEESKELSAGTVLEGEEEFLVVLEGVVELDDEGVVHAN